METLCIHTDTFTTLALKRFSGANGVKSFTQIAVFPACNTCVRLALRNPYDGSPEGQGVCRANFYSSHLLLSGQLSLNDLSKTQVRQWHQRIITTVMFLDDKKFDLLKKAECHKHQIFYSNETT